MVLQPRDHSEWWIDQNRRRWSNFDLWRAERAGELREVLVAEDEGVRIEATDEDSYLHMIRCPGPRLPYDVPSRALLSESDRQRLADRGGSAPQERERLKARLRWRLVMELPEDVRHLRRHAPELYADLRRTVLGADDEPDGRRV